MEISFEERKIAYIADTQQNYLPAERTWWEHPPPTRYLTSAYPYYGILPVVSSAAVLFKSAGKERMIVAVMAIVAAILLYLVGEKEFGITPVIVLLIALIIVLPALLYNKTLVRVSRDGLWMDQLKKTISWQWVILSYIRVVQEEGVRYFLELHYYDQEKDGFYKTELELDKAISPGLLSATIEAYRAAEVLAPASE